MLHPVGDQPPTTYWVRRIAVLAVVVLAFLTTYALLFRGGGNGSATPSASADQPVVRPSSTVRSSVPASTSVHSSPAATSKPATSKPATSAVASPAACIPSALTIAATSDAASYPVGGKPTLSLVVTNKGPNPCVADLSDQQIELRVFSGGARVWGSHDCAVQPGRSLQTLPVGKAVRRGIEWSGLASAPGCTSPRPRVPAGTYTVVALLAGQQGPPATFSFTS